MIAASAMTAAMTRPSVSQNPVSLLVLLADWATIDVVLVAAAGAPVTTKLGPLYCSRISSSYGPGCWTKHEAYMSYVPLGMLGTFTVPPHEPSGVVEAVAMTWEPYDRPLPMPIATR